MADIRRRNSVTCTIGKVRVGSDAPLVVQSMTNTDTADVLGTVKQVEALARAGSELVRVTVNNDEAAKGVPQIVDLLERRGIDVPIIGDFHYNGHLLLKKYPECARALAKYRINPGNVSVGRKDDDNFRIMVEVAVENQKPVRIGVNWGSLDQQLLTRMMDENSRSAEPKDARDVTMEAMVVSALNSAKLAEKYGLRRDQIILSAKVSGVQDLVDVYRNMAARCDYALHLGLTEAGMGAKGIAHLQLASAFCCRRASETRFASRSHLLPTAIAPKKCSLRNRFCNRWAFAASPLKSQPAPVADAPPALSSRRWPNRSKAICANRCLSGSSATPASKR